MTSKHLSVYPLIYDSVLLVYNTNILHRHTYGGQLLDLLVGRAQRGESDFLRELGERAIGQQRHVSQQLVNAIATMIKTKRTHEIRIM